METDQKIEDLLNLALEATPQERARSLELDVGFDEKERTWDLIIKYSGSLEEVRAPGIEITELANGYAVVTAAQEQIPYLASRPQIEYIEKPKRLFFETQQGRTASCMDALQITDGPAGAIPGRGKNGALLGQGILVAVIDSGVDYTHPDFCNPDGTTRILAIWDQSVAGSPPAGYALGTEYTKAQIDEALRTGERLPVRDISGHGTQVLGIAAGNGRSSLSAQERTRPDAAAFGPNRGAAPLAHILVVKLGNPRPDSFPKTTELMQALDYVYRKAQELSLPVAVNLSFGNVYGPHNGTGLLEQFLSDIAFRWESVVAVGAGNEGGASGHAAAVLGQGGAQEIQMGVAAFETSVNVQLWKSYADEIAVSIVHPGGQSVGPLFAGSGAQRFRLGNTELLIFYGEPSPYSMSQEIYVDFLPVGDYIDNGIWRFRLEAEKIADGRLDLWLPQAESLNRGTMFYEPSAENTLTIPSTARNIIAVGAYDARQLTYAPFSGRGAEAAGSLPGPPDVKPDLAAPGVRILTTAAGGGYTAATGTSFAAPFVTGAAAMLMQWGIVNGNDRYLYGEKVRAYLIRGARPLPGFARYPNNRVGYGTLCVRDSLPETYPEN